MQPLDIRVASPCPASWAAMTGDDKARFCAQCRLNVYNLSAMSHEEARQLIAKKEGRLCVRFYQRKDGTVLTADCPVGLAAARRRTFSLASALAALALAAVGLTGFSHTPYGRQMLRSLGDWIEGRESAQADPEDVQVMMGKPCIDPRPPDPSDR